MTLEDQRTEALQALSATQGQLETARDAVLVAKAHRDSLQKRVEALIQQVINLDTQINARSFVANATITTDIPNPWDYGFTQIFREGERVQVRTDGDVMRADGEVYSGTLTKGKVRLDSDP